MKRIAVIGVFTLAVSASGFVLSAQEAPAQAASFSSPALYNCTLLTVRPTSIVLTCADSNRYIQDIKWRSWTSTSADATGTLHWNDCTPACFDGKWHSARIHFIARKPATLSTHRIFTELYGPAGAWGTGSRVWELPTKPE
jgi:hypothetical protein